MILKRVAFKQNLNQSTLVLLTLIDTYFKQKVKVGFFFIILLKKLNVLNRLTIMKVKYK